MAVAQPAFGIDIGGSGMKAAPVDLAIGDISEDRLKIETPHPATPDAMTDVVVKLVEHFKWTGPVGVTFPGVVRRGVIRSAANVDSSWMNVDADAMFSKATGCEVHVVNDADAAGLAEMRWGAGKDRKGVVLLLTLGTGIGSALFVDGILVPNTELGHLELDGHDAEHKAAASAREREDLSWKEWARRLQRYLKMVIGLFDPDLIILGGGVSRRSGKWLNYIDVEVEVVPATLTNEAGIVGAALVSTMSSAPE